MAIFILEEKRPNDRFRTNAAPNCDFFVLNLLRIFSGVNTAILLIYGLIQCEMGFIGHDNFVVKGMIALYFDMGFYSKISLKILLIWQKNVCGVSLYIS